MHVKESEDVLLMLSLFKTVACLPMHKDGPKLESTTVLLKEGCRVAR